MTRPAIGRFWKAAVCKTVGAGRDAGELAVGARRGAGELAMGAGRGAGDLAIGAGRGAGELAVGAGRGAGELVIGVGRVPEIWRWVRVGVPGSCGEVSGLVCRRLSLRGASAPQRHSDLRNHFCIVFLLQVVLRAARQPGVPKPVLLFSSDFGGGRPLGAPSWAPAPRSAAAAAAARSTSVGSAPPPCWVGLPGLAAFFSAGRRRAAIG